MLKIVYNAVRRHIYQVKTFVFDPMNKGEYSTRLLNYVLWHVIYKYFGKRWIVTFENGAKSFVYPHPDHDAGEVDIWTRNNDYHETLYIRSILAHGDYIYDIGCNVGNRTWVLSDLISGALLIDAGEQAVARTKENRDLNNLDAGDFPVLLAAAGSKSGVVLFSDLGGASTLNHVIIAGCEIGSVPSREVVMTTIDKEVADRGRCPSFIKIDAEGHDLEVLQGGRTSLASGGVKLVKFERNRNVELQPFIEFFDELNWSVFALDKLGLLSQASAVIEQSPNLFAAPLSAVRKLIRYENR